MILRIDDVSSGKEPLPIPLELSISQDSSHETIEQGVTEANHRFISIDPISPSASDPSSTTYSASTTLLISRVRSFISNYTTCLIDSRSDPSDRLVSSFKDSDLPIDKTYQDKYNREDEEIGCGCVKPHDKSQKTSCSDSSCTCVQNHGFFYKLDRVNEDYDEGDSERFDNYLLSIDDIPRLHPIYECSSDFCGCSIEDCNNRITQSGIRVQLAIRNSSIPNSGLGLFSNSNSTLKRGQFICLYAGELIDHNQAQRSWSMNHNLKQKRTSEPLGVDELSLEFGNGIEGAGGMNYILSILESNSLRSWSTIIDPTHRGNVGFINHACPPLNSLFILPVRPMGQVVPLPALFALRDIHKDEELTFDYADAAETSSFLNTQKGLNNDPLNQTLSKPCFCGSPMCRSVIPYNPRA